MRGTSKGEVHYCRMCCAKIQIGYHWSHRLARGCRNIQYTRQYRRRLPARGQPVYLKKKQYLLLCNHNIGRQLVDLEFNVFLCSWIVLLYGSGYALLHYHNVFHMHIQLCVSVHQYTYIVVYTNI